MPTADSYRNGAWQTAFPREAMFCQAEANRYTVWAEEWRTYGHLTEESTTDLVALLDAAEEAEQDAPALAWDALEIPNGDYSVQVTSPGFTDEDGCLVGQQSTFSFRVHLVSEGTLAGKRIIKYRPEGESLFRGFAFLTRSGGFSLWRRFDRDALEPYVEAARKMVDVLHRFNPAHTNNSSTSAQLSGRPLSSLDGGVRYDIVVRHRCAIGNCEIDRDDEGTTSPITWCESHTPRIEAAPRLHTPSATTITGQPRRARGGTRERSLPMCEVTGTEVQ